MKSNLLILFISFSIAFAQTPFHRGVNLTNWFQSGSAHQIQFNKFGLQDLQNIQSLGCDVIRLPINLHDMTSGAPDYTIDPLLFYFLDQVVDWAEALNMHLILDNHSFDPAVSTSPQIGDILIPVWQQMAAHFKNRSRLVYYEILNEPHGIADDTWNAIQQRVIAAIRSIDTVHTIVVGPAGWNGYNNLQYMPFYSDSNLIYTFHFYEPFLFTHQGAGWTNPSMVSLAGVPFPYSASRMPDCPPDLKGTWIESEINNYANKGTVGYVRQQLDIAINFAQQRHVPIYCGEFGVYMLNSNPGDRTIWYQITRSYLEDHQTPWTMWDYKGGFGLFEKGSNALFDYDLNVPLLNALGLNVPEQYEFVMRPDSIGFVLFDDYFGRGIEESGYTSQGVLDYYDESDPHSGKFCLAWSGAQQYNSIGFDFVPNKDLSYLKDQGFVLDFWLKAQGQGASFDVRFLDTKTDDPDDHPWRMKVTIAQNQIGWNGQWQEIRLPLKDFVEGGSWDNGWFEPQGKFDWKQVDRFEIVAEQGNLTGTQFWFDDIRIVDPNLIGINNTPSALLDNFELKRLYPNPFNGRIQIEYSVNTPSFIRLEIFDMRGKKVRVLQIGKTARGSYRVIWDGRGDGGKMLSSGIYVVRLSGHGQSSARKILLIR